jgi:hypothetical protein
MGKNDTMRSFDSLGKKKVVIGMVHLQPLPGTPFYQEGTMEQSAPLVADATAFIRADGCLVQTMDRVYPPRTRPITPAWRPWPRLCGQCPTPFPTFQVGVQIMMNALKPPWP